MNLFIGCGNSMEGGPCAGLNVQCGNRILDSVFLDTNKNLAPYFNKASVDTFYNKIADAKQTFNVSASPFILTQINLVATTFSNGCLESKTCYQTGKTQNRIITYTNQLTNNLNIVVRWEKQYFPMVTSPVEPNLVAFKNLGDRFTIQFGATADLILIPDFDFYGASKNQIFHHKLDINGHLVDSVFEFKRDVNPNIIATQGVYYSKKLGIVGFFLTDKKEEWLKLF